MEVGVVIPVGPDRVENLLEVLKALSEQTVKPKIVIIVCDGPDAAIEVGGAFTLPLAVLVAPEKHEPGKEQPRNVGVSLLGDLARDNEQLQGLTHVWFLDSDVIPAPDCLEMYEAAMAQEPIERILCGPYDWMPEGQREPMPELKNDPRWVSFDQYEPFKMFTEDLSAGLACFSGNLVWPLKEFERVGGFWNDLHHGRCEDGELGLRAVSMGVPISYVKDARAWHLWHPIDLERTQQANARDVPLLNERHPWVQGEGLFVVDQDGKRFQMRCPNCGQEFNSALIWDHKRDCPNPEPEDDSVFPMPGTPPDA